MEEQKNNEEESNEQKPEEKLKMPTQQKGSDEITMPEHDDEKDLADALLGEESEEIHKDEPAAAAKKKEPKAKKEETKAKDKEKEKESNIYAIRTTANREDQVTDFVASNAAKKKLKVYSIIKPHEMRGYIFIEAETRSDAEQAAFNIPYARGLLPNTIGYNEIEHMLEQVKVQMNILKGDIVEIISGPFKRENAKVSRIDRQKEEVVVELLEAAVPIPITVKMDSVKVIRRDKAEEEEASGDEDEM